MRPAQERNADLSELLASLESTLEELAGLMTQKSINPSVIEKLNDAAGEFSKVAQQKGYDAAFLVETSLHDSSDLTDINQKIRDFKTAVEMLEKLYFYSSGKTD
jgi:hypothetical protein